MKKIIQEKTLEMFAEFKTEEYFKNWSILANIKNVYGIRV